MANNLNKKEDLDAFEFNPSIYFNSYAEGGLLGEDPTNSPYAPTYGDLPPEVLHYMRMPGVNPDKVMAWFNLGISEPQTFNQARLLAEAVGYNPEQAKVVAGQWQMESSGGSRLSSPYNYFGIKSHNEAVRNKLAERGIDVSAGKEAATTEGAGKASKASFMEFNNAFEGFAAHRAFLETNPRYQKALSSNTAKDFAVGLEKAGYATAPNYGTRLYQDYVAPKEKNPESGDARPKSLGETKSEKIKPTTFEIKPEVEVNALPTLAPQILEGFSPEINREPTVSEGMYGATPYETEVKATKPISMSAPRGWFGSGQSTFKQGGSMNFKSPGAYHKWLGYVHATGLAESTPGNQKVSIGGEPHKVQHAFGGNMYAQGGFNNAGFRALPTDIQNKIKTRSFAAGGQMDPLTEFNAGGSHEQNPLGGIPQGTAPDGRPNLVEQGETKLNAANYIFSDKIKVSKEIAQELNLPKNSAGKTFAEVSKNINTRNGNSRREKGYDKIEDKARDTELETLMNAQEMQKQMQMQADMQEMMTKYPEEMGALLQGANAGGQMGMNPQDQMASQQDMAMQQGMEGQPSPEQIAMMQEQGAMGGAPQGPPQGNQDIMPTSQVPMSYGGSLYGCGGSMYDFGGFMDDNSAGLAGAGTGALSGASTGAMLGAATGPLAFIGAPLGAGIGAGIGAVSGFLKGHKQDKAEQTALDEQRQQQIAQSNQGQLGQNAPYVTPNAMGAMPNGNPGMAPTYAAYGGRLNHGYPQLTSSWKNGAGPMGQPLTNMYAAGGELFADPGVTPTSGGPGTPSTPSSHVPPIATYAPTLPPTYAKEFLESYKQYSGNPKDPKTGIPMFGSGGADAASTGTGGDYRPYTAAERAARIKEFEGYDTKDLRPDVLEQYLVLKNNKPYFVNPTQPDKFLYEPYDLRKYTPLSGPALSAAYPPPPPPAPEPPHYYLDANTGQPVYDLNSKTGAMDPRMMPKDSLGPRQYSQYLEQQANSPEAIAKKGSINAEMLANKNLLDSMTEEQKAEMRSLKQTPQNFLGREGLPFNQAPGGNFAMGGHMYDGYSENSGFMYNPNYKPNYNFPSTNELLTNPWVRNNNLGLPTNPITTKGNSGAGENGSGAGSEGSGAGDHYDVDTALTSTAQDISTKGTAFDVLANAAPVAYNVYQALSKPKQYNANDFYTSMEAMRPDYTQATNEARYTYANLMDSIKAGGLSGGNYATNAQNAANLRNKAMGQVAMAEEDAFRQDQAHVRDINTSAYDKARAAAEQLNLATQVARQEHGKEALTGIKDWKNKQISDDLAMQYAALGAPDITRFKKFGYTPFSEVIKEKYLNKKG